MANRNLDHGRNLARTVTKLLTVARPHEAAAMRFACTIYNPSENEQNERAEPPELRLGSVATSTEMCALLLSATNTYSGEWTAALDLICAAAWAKPGTTHIAIDMQPPAAHWRHYHGCWTNAKDGTNERVAVMVLPSNATHVYYTCETDVIADPMLPNIGWASSERDALHKIIGDTWSTDMDKVAEDSDKEDKKPRTGAVLLT